MKNKKSEGVRVRKEISDLIMSDKTSQSGSQDLSDSHEKEVLFSVMQSIKPATVSFNHEH